ncbi:TadE/TadG family type IV pilus assembly protein [Microlunatus sp. Gsoil 973]|uniref:TadE/TadG family type IV pilus assembly protein n=1 Tax=Microlunatus sp. Gsoil 973 TaxID=2672569 RepID=UPI0012B4568D|nr:TadE family protein [Microlunatus sp. Gsoil 973]QGN33303.1 pilus assembly protein [Microlunatus sp. Gsoil 973]
MTRPIRDRGAVAVEFALVVPLLVLLILGIAEFGRAYYLQTTISGAAREAARVMALANDPSATANVSHARAAAKVAASNLGLTDGQIAITPATCVTNGTAPTATVTVKVSYPLTFITSQFGSPITLIGTGVMRCNG